MTEERVILPSGEDFILRLVEDRCAGKAWQKTAEELAAGPDPDGAGLVTLEED